MIRLPQYPPLHDTPHHTQHQEYSARYGLKNSSINGAENDINIARQIAEAKYRALVGRDILISEISEIHLLIEELRNWSATPQVPEITCTH